MTDPRDHAQRHDADRITPSRPRETRASRARAMTSRRATNSARRDELDADNAVEADMIETVDPENPPA